MILDKNDPTGLGLFSRCARNLASKTKTNRPASAHVRKQTTINIEDSNRKKNISEAWFEKQESREQRQRKYTKQSTPAVGQYNPHKKDQPKMVWDILKVYHSLTKPIQKFKHSTSPEKLRKTRKAETENIIEPNERSGNGSQLQQNNLPQESHLMQQNSKSLNQFQRVQTTGSVLNKSHCVVNMSRMIGRRVGQTHPTEEASFITQARNPIKSIDYIKGKISKNIFFAKQPKQILKRHANPAGSSYTYNSDLIKPRRKGIVGFAKLKGRNQVQKMNQDPRQYSYEHYDYNSYVWESNSSVFPNTKTHVISFSKQSNRYKEKDPNQ